jgi:hypothetical protein
MKYLELTAPTLAERQHAEKPKSTITASKVARCQ